MFMFLSNFTSPPYHIKENKGVLHSMGKIYGEHGQFCPLCLLPFGDILLNLGGGGHVLKYIFKYIYEHASMIIFLSACVMYR